MKIQKITAREIFDSRGNPTVAASCWLVDGTVAEAAVPSGASTGRDEAFELRDGDPKRFNGLGVLRAIANIEKIISPALIGQDAKDQSGIDKKMIQIDGSENKENLGANSILAVSLAVARAQAIADDIELYEYLGVKFNGAHRKRYYLPTPMFNVINGGKHAENNIDIQETMIVPIIFKSFKEKMRAGVEIYQALKKELFLEGLSVGLGDEGGFAPNLRSNKNVFVYIERAIEEAGYSKNSVRIAIDLAADSLYDSKKKTYLLRAEKKDFDPNRLINILSLWARDYKIFSIEDGLFENDNKWSELTKKIKPTLSIGDDLLVTQKKKIEKAAKEKKANGVIIKLNQVGTLSEAVGAVKEAQKNKLKVIVSHRSGETSDPFIADFAVAAGADFIKSGAPARSERLAKYNRLLRIEEHINLKNK